MRAGGTFTSPALAGLGREERTKVEARSAEGEGGACGTAPYALS
jgi:hypothetical protein